MLIVIYYNYRTRYDFFLRKYSVNQNFLIKKFKTAFFISELELSAKNHIFLKLTCEEY